MGFSLVQNQKAICFKHYTLEVREVSLNWLTLFQNLVDFTVKVNHSSTCWSVASLNGYWKEIAGRVCCKWTMQILIKMELNTA